MVAETKKAHEVQWYGSTLFETDDVLLADRVVLNG